MNEAGFPVAFYIVPALVFGPVVLTVFYKLGISNLRGLPQEMIAKRKSAKNKFFEDRKRRGFV